jgi:hypothetical protein
MAEMDCPEENKAEGDCAPPDGSAEYSWNIPGWMTFFRVHLLYLMGLGAVGAVAIWVVEAGNVAFIDALFQSISCVTGTGLSILDQGHVKSATHVRKHLVCSTQHRETPRLRAVYRMCLCVDFVRHRHGPDRSPLGVSQILKFSLVFLTDRPPLAFSDDG